MIDHKPMCPALSSVGNFSCTCAKKFTVTEIRAALERYDWLVRGSAADFYNTEQFLDWLEAQ